MKRQPDVLIKDFRLADDLTGLDVITLLSRQYGQDIPALIVTGDTDQQTIELMNPGKWQVLHKAAPAAKIRAFLDSIQTSIG